jgi:hypothetical protein
MEMPWFFQMIDPYLVWCFRITGHSLADFLLGTLILALLTMIIGEMANFLAFLALRKQLEEVTAKAAKYQDLSVEALMAGDKPSYKAANHLANEAFGKAFFMQVALSAGFLWPVCFALAWMQYRFQELEYPIPFTGLSLGFIGVFILIFIPVYILFRRVKSRLPFFRRLNTSLENCDRKRRGLKTFGDLLAPPSKPALPENGE